MQEADEAGAGGVEYLLKVGFRCCLFFYDLTLDVKDKRQRWTKLEEEQYEGAQRERMRVRTTTRWIR